MKCITQTKEVKDTKVAAIPNKINEKVLDSKMNSFSSINFEDEKNESSHECRNMLHKEFDSHLSSNDNEMLSSKILDEFSMIHYRKTK